MSAQISANTLVHLVYIRPTDNKKGWLCTPPTFEYGRLLRPLIDDDPRQSRPMRFDLAVVAQRRFRDELRPGIPFRLALEPNGEFIDEVPEDHSNLPKHCNYFYVPDENADPDLGYEIIAVCRPSGKEFALFFRNPTLRAQTVYVPQKAGPFSAILKAHELGLLAFEPPYLRSDATAREAERQTQAANELKKAQLGDARLRRPDLM